MLELPSSEYVKFALTDPRIAASFAETLKIAATYEDVRGRGFVPRGNAGLEIHAMSGLQGKKKVGACIAIGTVLGVNPLAVSREIEFGLKEEAKSDGYEYPLLIALQRQ